MAKQKKKAESTSTKELDREAMRPVRKSENGRYRGMTMEDMSQMDEDGESLKKKK